MGNRILNGAHYCKYIGMLIDENMFLYDGCYAMSELKENRF